MYDMIEEKLKMLSEVKDCLLTAFKSKLSEGLDKMDTKEAGEVVDMIKDLAEAEKYCAEKCYFESVVCAMEEYGDGAAGYDNWRYSNGRFAPKGSGHRTGYHMPIPPEMFKDWDNMSDRMGYPNNVYASNGNSGNYSSNGGSGRGYNYDRFDRARRYFTESGDPNSKHEMNESAKQYMGDTIMTIKEVMRSADPELQRKMKSDLSNLINTMP